MSVPSIASKTYNYSLDTVQKNIKDFRENFQLLGQALQSGSLSSARLVFSTLQQLLPNASQNRLQGTSQNAARNAFAEGFDTLGEALQSGDLDRAGNAYTALQSNPQTASRTSSSIGAARSHATAVVTKRTCLAADGRLDVRA